MSIILAIFLGIFNENFGVKRHLRAQELLTINSELLAKIKSVETPIDQEVLMIKKKYIEESAILIKKRDKARKEFFTLPTEIRNISRQGKIIKYEYLYAVYELILLKHQKDMMIKQAQIRKYSQIKDLRLNDLKY